HLNGVVSTPALRDAYHANLPKMTAFYADLAQDKRLYARYQALSLSPSFAHLDAANAFALYVDDASRLAGIPDPVLAAARDAAREEGRTGWKLTLRMPCYRPVMCYADDRALRAELHRAYATRASELGAKPEWDNTPVIARILELRREAAQLLGY